MRKGGSAGQRRAAAASFVRRLSPERGAAALVLVCALSLLVWAQPGLVMPDGAGYYVYLPSTWLDGDILFFNEWQRLGLISDGIPVFKSATDTGHLGNHWTIGPALLWYPAFLAGDLARAVMPSFSHFDRDGFVLPYNLAMVTASAAAGAGVLLLGYFIALRWYSRRDAALAALATWFGTTLLWYSVREAAMSHAISAFACALVVYLSLRLRDDRGPAAALAVGLALGFAALVRIQNAAFLFVPFVLLRGAARKDFIRNLHAFIAGGFLAVLPELVVSTILYGNPLGFASIGVRGIGWDPWTRFWAVETLFSWYHGLFTWTPLAALGVGGLFALWRADRRLASAGLIMFVVQWITNASADRAFWAALSFGARRFDNCAIFFLLGVAALMHRGVWRIVAAACAAWTMLLFYAGRHLDLNAYQTPPELLETIVRSLGDGVSILMFIPASFRAAAAGTIALAALACVAVLAVFLAVPVRLRPAVAALYFAVMTAFIARAGAIGAARIPQYQAMVDRSRTFAAVAGREVGEQNLYENEIRYLRKTGRIEEAERTEEELREVMRRRREALARAAQIR